MDDTNNHAHESPYPALPVLEQRITVLERRSDRTEEKVERQDQRLVEGTIAIAEVRVLAKSLDSRTEQLVDGQKRMEETFNAKADALSSTLSSLGWKFLAGAGTIAAIIAALVSTLIVVN